MSKETLYINLYGSPGTGKTTTMAGVFHALKNKGVNCEMVSEFAKDLVWEERHKTFQNEIYIFAKQHQRLFRLKGKVDIVITDRPLLLTCVYNDMYGQNQFTMLNNLVREQYTNFRNVDILLNRTKSYNPVGRNQTEEESDVIARYIKDMLSTTIPYYELDADVNVVDKILDIIEDELVYLDYLSKLEKYDKFIDGAVGLQRIIEESGSIEGWGIVADTYNGGTPIVYRDKYERPELLLRAALSQVYVEKEKPLCKHCNNPMYRGVPSGHIIFAYCEHCNTSHAVFTFGELL